MIYPRLKLKSEVFANVLDGKKTEFTVVGEEEQETKVGDNEEMEKQM